MKRITTLVLGLLLSLPLLAQPRLLMVLSSHGEHDSEQNIVQPGFEFDELAKAYNVFSANGIEVDIASPKGGLPLADNYDPQKAYNQTFIQDKQAMDKLSHSLKLKAVNASDYQGIFVVGGKGPMFDLHQDNHLQALIRQIWENQGVVSAVCHGPAALVDVTLSDGSYLVAGKRVNGFTNQEEMAFGKKWRPQFAFLLQDKLSERGAKFERSSLMLNHVAQDDRLITGQNPFSTVDTALAVVKAMGIDTKTIPAYADDQTIKLVRRLLEGEAYTTEQLKAEQDIQVELLGMYGYYLAQFAESQVQQRQAAQLMELVQPIMQHPVLALETAKVYQSLGDATQARDTLNALLQTHPDMEEAKLLLQSLNGTQTDSE
ncbi:type 1 glutamine amidotransferase domain-containing protein [Bowmanella dokdonensis]|uniref:DJ-1/PfpI family protein n=1 Tax=Bowmanella dokdonensis TaxID=751969 RepID=A0A939DK64_9ALTE|nr:type 1 glutamine amidotransferase domain-containing protein [Bowmanella dokdonensis]MBN7824223.1 DJ-1/PfpI family protein [Bowmanella dokdonensis]